MLPNTTALSVRLTESVVPLRSVPSRHTIRPHHEIPSQGSDTDPPAVVRGLLTLRLAKPTKVSSIELKLCAKASTHYTKGVGPGPVDVTERYSIHSTSSFVFRAGAASRQHSPSCTSTRSRAQPLDGGAHTDRVGGEEGEVPSAVTPSASLDPQSLSARQCSLGIDDSRGPQQDQIPTGPAPPYPDSVRRHFSFGFISQPTVTGRLRPIAINSRVTESASSPCHPLSSPTSDASLPSPSSSTHSMHNFVPECDSESSDDDSVPSPNDVAYYGLSRVAASSSSRSPEQGRRGRSRSRLSFGNVVQIFDAVKDRLRSRSPRYKSGPRSDEQEERGRSLFKGKEKAQTGIDEKYGLPETEIDESLLDESKPNGDGWVVFPQGTYTYPIFFTIPNNSPPTMRTDYGSLTWKVKSKVKQPSASKPKITAQKEVIVVCVPRDDDFEDVNGIDVQRQWEDQLQYRIQVAGRGFPVGGQIPFQLTITPLAKAKVHCILVYLDERTEYYTRSESHTGSDAIRRTTLLAVKHNNLGERQSEPILPLTSDEPDRFRKSPLYQFLVPGEDEREVASSFMGLGPWTIRHLLRVPESCSKLHPSNRAKGSNVMVSHTLKTVLRVEREDGIGSEGRKKLYDILILTPIQILSCRCTSAWTALPRYEEALLWGVGSGEDIETSLCPCRTHDQAKTRTDSHMDDILEHVTSLTTDSNVGASEIWPLDSLAGRTHLHERLISGLVSERGEAPPSYEHASALCVR